MWRTDDRRSVVDVMVESDLEIPPEVSAADSSSSPATVFRLELLTSRGTKV